MTKYKQETLAEFEDRKNKVKFKNFEEVFERLHREFNAKWLFYKYYQLYEKLLLDGEYL